MAAWHDVAPVLSALYDQPRTGSVVNRWRRLRSRLGLGWLRPVPWAWVGASVGRHEARYLVDPAGASTFTWRLGYGAGSDAAAWYVDDIRYVRVAEFPRVRFVAP